MNMKKLAASAACVMMLAALSACGSEPISTAENSGSAGTQQSQQAAETTTDAGSANAGIVSPSFSFFAGSTEIRIKDESDPIVAALGTPGKQFEAPSCAFSGTSYTYEYPGYTIETYPDGATNRVYAVTLTDATAATAEGFKIGDTAAAVKAKFGEPEKESGAFLQYSKDGVDLQFFLEGDNVSSIVYTYHLG